MNHTASVLIVFCLAASLLTGCAITSEVVVWNARKRHHFTAISSIEGGTLHEGVLFVRLQVQRYQHSESEMVLLPIPINRPDWPTPEDAAGPRLNDSYEVGFALRHLPSNLLVPPDSQPQTGTPIPIHRIELQHTDEIAKIIENAEPGLQVFALSIAPHADDYCSYHWLYEEAEQTTRQVLAVSSPELDDKGLVVFDFYEGSHRQLWWYALAPVTVAADVVTAPLQVILVLVAGS